MKNIGLPDKRAIPGFIAMILVTLVTTFWMYWGAIEMYYEGWGTAFPFFLFYLLPFTFTWVLALIALTWPRIGGWLLIVIGGTFSAWMLNLQVARGATLTWQFVLVWAAITLSLVLIGMLFLLDGRYRRQRRAAGQPLPASWLHRNWRYLFVIGVPLLMFVGVTIYWAPILMTRVDDGNRGARLIAGNGVTLIWAPEGPGWNWWQPWGGYLSWDRIALYGISPIGVEEKPGYTNRHATAADMATTGLCRYLSEDGTTLMDEPQNIWRMPTADEVVRSLALHGDNAGCTWNDTVGPADCAARPDKETPLWAPDMEPIYYWVADEFNAEEAYFVNYQGYANCQPKNWGNPRHSYRCVREP